MSENKKVSTEENKRVQTCNRWIGTADDILIRDFFLATFIKFKPIEGVNLPESEKLLVDFSAGIFIKFENIDGVEYCTTFDLVEVLKDVPLININTKKIVKEKVDDLLKQQAEEEEELAAS